MGAPTQLPPEHRSGAVHVFPSLHGLLSLFVNTQSPVVVLHESSVHGLSSLQFGPAPGTHEPAEQRSPIVHAFPSLHVLLSLFAFTHVPVVVLHESSVHGLLSLQSFCVPGAHAPAEHVSPTVHAFPSSQAFPSVAIGFEQAPVVWLIQVPATWHWSSAVQVTPTQ